MQAARPASPPIVRQDTRPPSRAAPGPSWAPNPGLGGTWMQQLTGWWAGRRGQLTAAAASGATPAAAPVVNGAQDAAAGIPAAAAQGKEHLVVMVHGLFGTADNWTVCAAGRSELACGSAPACRQPEGVLHLAPTRLPSHPHCPMPPRLQAISGLLADHLDPEPTLLFVSHCNERQKVGTVLYCR